MKKACILLVLLYNFLAIYGENNPEKQKTFVEKDIFQTKYFLKNVPGLVPNYQGDEIKYFANLDGLSVFLTDNRIIYKASKREPKKNTEQIDGQKEENHFAIFNSYISVKWTDANPHPQIEVTEKNSAYYTFLAGKTAKDLHTIVTNGFRKVTYYNLYPGIDLEYILPEKGGFKYNFIIHAGADASKIKMEYNGDIKNINQDNNGNIIVQTETGSLLEHAPIAYLDNSSSILSYYQIYNRIVSLSFPTGYNHSQTLIIDPWVTVLDTFPIDPLGTSNWGISLDYDSKGNLYAYGSGNKVALAKYDLNGNCIWVFNDSVQSIGYSINDYCFSNARVDRGSDKIYIGKMLDESSSNGMQAIRLTSSGLYDNFISAQIDNFNEMQSVNLDCGSGSILAFGSGTFGYYDIQLIDSVMGNVTEYNYTNDTTTSDFFQDVVCGTHDLYGNLYVIMNGQGVPDIDNKIFKVDTSYRNYIWKTPTGYNSFMEDMNIDYLGNDNNFNSLAANGYYLYFYDGKHIKAFDLNNGSTVGSPFLIPGYDSLLQGGIAVDNCNNLYIGGKGVIKTFTFNGVTFTPDQDIPLGVDFLTNAVLDVRYNPANNLLYVTGYHVVGTYVAPLSSNCSLYTTFVNVNCREAIVNVAYDSILHNPNFTFIWKDSTGNTIRHTNFDSIQTDTLRGLHPGRYTVQALLNINCWGYVSTDSFIIPSAQTPIWFQKQTTIPCNSYLKLSGTNPSGGYFTGPYVHGDSIIAPGIDTTFTITYTFTDSNSCTASVSLQFHALLCTGIANIDESSNIYLYPNPNNGSFILEAPNAIGATYIVHNILGQLIDQGVITTQQTPITMLNAAQGVYLLKVQTASPSHAIKFTVVR